jgi:hypothetical protein
MEGILWECAKSNKIRLKSGDTVRYALLLGYAPGEDGFVPLAVHGKDDPLWKTNILEETETIHRRIPGEVTTFRVYDWSKESQTWLQRLQDS